MYIIQIADPTVKIIKPHKWVEGLATSSLTNMLFLPHFSHSVQASTYVNQLLVCAHRGYLFLDQPNPITVELIARITGLPSGGKDLLPYLVKHKTQDIKRKYNLRILKRTLQSNPPFPIL